MALERSFSFPQSHLETTSRTSPFNVDQDDVGKLDSCETFQIIRSLLIRQQNSTFCPHHYPSTKEDEEAWLLQRDIIHTLILPVIEIYSYASQLATRVLGDRNIFDLELVFREEARGAFSWLQCFIIEEEAWCSTRGCPACIVNYVLQTEPTIRMVLVACRLSQSLRKPNGDSSPVMDFWLSTLQRAMDEDPFWGPGFWEDIEARALPLVEGIQQLVQQCHNLGGLLSSNGNLQSSNLSTSVVYRPHPSKPSEGHSSLANEGIGWVEKIVLNYWSTILGATTEAGQKKSIPCPPIRS